VCINDSITEELNTMEDNTKLIGIKTTHTMIWVCFNVVIFYMLYAVIVDKIDIWLWVGYGLVLMETLVLFAFKLVCPLTIAARKYSTSTDNNFDIFLPEWLAQYTKLIYTSIMLVVVVITVYRLLQ
jgi:hypothetical protein